MIIESNRLLYDIHHIAAGVEKDEWRWCCNWDYFDGGGEKKGIVGMVVGMVGIEGMVGNEVAGSGGRVTLGTAGIVGIGKEDGIWVLGKGGNVVGFGKVGAAGSVGKAVLGNGGSVACGMVGSVGNGGNATLGIVGTVCSRWRAAWVVWMLESANAKIRDRTKQCWKASIV